MVPFSFEEWDFDPFSDWKPAWRLCDWAQYGTMIVYKPAYESCSGRCRRKKLLWFFFWSIIVASSHLKARQVVQSGNWEFSLKCLLVLVMHQNVPDMITHTSETFATKTISPTKKGVTFLWCDGFCSYQPFLGPAISIWSKNPYHLYGIYIYIYCTPKFSRKIIQM